MKKRICLFLCLVLCICLAGCASKNPVYQAHSFEFNTDGDVLYYNDHTYIANPNGELFEFFYIILDDNWVKVAALPWDPMTYSLYPVTTTYYGDDIDNPIVICCSRTNSIWVREDITLDHNSMLSACNTKEAVTFRIPDITTENSLPYSADTEDRRTHYLVMEAAFVDCPLVTAAICFSMIDGTVYLQTDTWGDYLEVTDEFVAILEQMEDWQ